MNENPVSYSVKAGNDTVGTFNASCLASKAGVVSAKEDGDFSIDLKAGSGDLALSSITDADGVVDFDDACEVEVDCVGGGAKEKRGFEGAGCSMTAGVLPLLIGPVPKKDGAGVAGAPLPKLNAAFFGCSGGASVSISSDTLVCLAGPS